MANLRAKLFGLFIAVCILFASLVIPDVSGKPEAGIPDIKHFSVIGEPVVRPGKSILSFSNHFFYSC